jgi:hypothetical protein
LHLAIQIEYFSKEADMSKDSSEVTEIRRMLEWINEEEEQSRREETGVAPFPYERLAKIYRGQKNYSAEVDILERFARQKHVSGVKPLLLSQRLKEAKVLLTGNVQKE